VKHEAIEPGDLITCDVVEIDSLPGIYARPYGFDSTIPNPEIGRLPTNTAMIVVAHADQNTYVVSASLCGWIASYIWKERLLVIE